MKYAQLRPEYKYRCIADAIHARESEHFHYSFDARNFEYLLQNLPDGPYKDDVSKRLAETNEQMKNVVLIVDALYAQIDDPVAYAEAVAYVTEKREQEEGAP